MRFLFFAALAAGALALSACDGPTGGPGGTPALDNPPETAARELALGQLVTESLESTADVDVFAVTVPAGGLGMLQIQGTQEGQGGLSVTVFDSTTPGASLATVTGFASDPGEIRFALPAGRLMVRVQTAGGSGGYLMALHRVDTRPESADSVLPLRQWAQGDLSPFFDVDEYLIDGVAGQEVRLYLENPKGFLYAVLRAPGQSLGDTLLYVFRGPGWVKEDGVVRLPVTGRYRLTVTTPDPLTEAMASPYRVMVFPVIRTPEGVNATLQHAQPVNEALDMPADIDEYTFTAAEGELIEFFFDVPAPGHVHFRMVDPATGQVMHQAAMDPHQPRSSMRFVAPRAGQFTLRTEEGQGAYRVELFRIDLRPEHVSSSIALEQTVQGESIDPSQDVDTYTFTGTAGTEVAMHIQGLLGSWMDLLPAEGDTPLVRLLVLQSGDVEGNTSTRVVLPQTGTYRVRVAHHPEPHTGISGEPVGPYRFRVSRVNYAPEFLSPNLVIGDTLRAEALEHRADVDVFTFQAQAGERLVLWGAKQVMGISGDLMMTVQRENGVVFVPLTQVWPTSITGIGSAFTAPVTGTYHVRVFSANSTSLDAMYTGTYRGLYKVGVFRAN